MKTKAFIVYIQGTRELRAPMLKTANDRATRVAIARADAHENYKSASRRMGALWTAWARVA